MGKRVLPVLVSVAALGMGALSVDRAVAQEAPVAPEQNQDIVVRAEPGDGSQIDRETYVVRDTPLARTKTATEVIQNLPSVTIDASGQLRLLGNGNVQILIDGRPVANAGTVLNTLNASQILRIEVMTNPSAQYSSYGSAGIINIILRRDFADGLGGSAVIGAGNPGYATVKLSPTWSGGRWSISASPSWSTVQSRSRSALERNSATPDPALNRVEIGSGEGITRSTSANFDMSYKPSERTRYTLSAALSRQNGESNQNVSVSSSAPNTTPFLQARSGRSALDTDSVALERKTTGDRDGEELSMSLAWSRYSIETSANYADFLPSGTRSFASGQSIDHASAGIKLDYQLPLRAGEKLSIGTEVQWDREGISDRANGLLLSGPVSSSNRFNGRTFDASAYVTFQTQFGGIKLLPGLRVNRREFAFDPTSGVSPRGETFLAPSLHVETAFGKLTTTFSISRRADWPTVGQYMPYRRITGPTTADIGSPALRPEHNLAIEMGARLPIAGQQLSLTLYSRRRSQVRDTSIVVASNGDIVSMPINAGDRTAYGGQFSIRGRFSPAWRYSASASFADARFDRLLGGISVRDRTTEYGGNAQLEYTSGRQGERGFQQATLSFRYQGPLENYQSRSGGIFALDFSYTRFLSDRWAVVGSVNRLLGTRTVSTQKSAVLFDERIDSNLYGPAARISLTYKFGQ